MNIVARRVKEGFLGVLCPVESFEEGLPKAAFNRVNVLSVAAVKYVSESGNHLKPNGWSCRGRKTELHIPRTPEARTTKAQ
jgi:hypothetical protein